MSAPLLLASSTPAPPESGTSLIEVALVIFMLVFVGITVWVLLVRRGGFKAQARIPLSDEPVEPRDPETGRPVDDPRDPPASEQTR